MLNLVSFLQNNLLGVLAFIITCILIYQYVIEREHGIKLSKKFRSSIFEAQSKIFLNATQYLIRGEKDLAIKEFLNAVELNKETLETYFALGGLFRSNGEIEKAISIHRSIMARSNISNSDRLRALKELGLDFDKGGLIDRAIETYHDALSINRDQAQIILALCRIYEDTEDWDEAYAHRMLLSKVGNTNQSKIISLILAQKGEDYFKKGDMAKARESVDDAFRFSPSIAAKILRLKLYLSQGALDDAKFLLLEIMREHSSYISFLFDTLYSSIPGNIRHEDEYKKSLELLKDYFLFIDDKDFFKSPSFTLAKVSLLKGQKNHEEACKSLKNIWSDGAKNNDQITIQYILELIETQQKDQAIELTEELLVRQLKSYSLYHCSKCGHKSDIIFWRCPACRSWETIRT